MIDTELNKKVVQRLEMFEMMEDISPSDGWSTALMKRTESLKPYKSQVFSPPKFALAVLIIIMLNIGIILTALLTDYKQSVSRDTALEIISKELLVNPNLLNK